MATITFIRKLVVNRILYTRNGARIGNAVIVAVNDGDGPALFSAPTYTIRTDYGTTAKYTADQIDMAFTLGPMTPRNHKHAVKVDVVAEGVRRIDWNVLRSLVENHLGVSPSNSELEAIIQKVWAGRPHEPVWSQGEDVSQSLGGAVREAVSVERPAPILKGNPEDYLL